MKAIHPLSFKDKQNKNTNFYQAKIQKIFKILVLNIDQTIKG